MKVPYPSFNDAEIEAFMDDVHGMWEPSQGDQLRLLATIELYQERLAAAEQRIRNQYVEIQRYQQSRRGTAADVLDRLCDRLDGAAFAGSHVSIAQLREIIGR